MPQPPATSAPSPLCPDCGYELNGLPGVICPECGADTIEAAAKELRRRSVHEHVVPYVIIFFVLVAPAALLAGLIDLTGTVIRTTLGVTFACCLVRFNAYPARDELATRLYQLVVLPMLLVAMAVSQSPHEYLRVSGDLMWNAALFACIGLPICWLFARARGSWRLVFGFGVVALLTSAWMQYTDYISGETGVWSVLGDPRLSQPYSQYPLRRNEVVFATAPGMALGVALIIASVIMRRRTRRQPPTLIASLETA